MVSVNSILLSKLPQAELDAIKKVSIESADKIAQFVNQKPPKWNELIKECTVSPIAYRAILKAFDSDKISEIVTVQALAFVDAFLSKDRLEHRDVEDLFINPECVTLQLEGKEETIVYSKEHFYGGPPYLMIRDLYNAQTTWPCFRFVPILGISEREEMIARIKAYQADIGLPLPGNEFEVHGRRLGIQGCISYDQFHAHSRSLLVASLGDQRFQLLMDHATHFEKVQKLLPPFTVELSRYGFEPIPHEDANHEDLCRYLLYIASGMIIDGNSYLTNFNFDEMNEQSIRYFLTKGYKQLKGIYQNKNNIDRRPTTPFYAALIQSAEERKIPFKHYDLTTIPESIIDETIELMKLHKMDAEWHITTAVNHDLDSGKEEDTKRSKF